MQRSHGPETLRQALFFGFRHGPQATWHHRVSAQAGRVGVPGKIPTSVCAGPLYAPDLSQDIPHPEISLWTVRTSPRGAQVPSYGNTEIPIRCVGVRHSLTGVRILVAPEIAPVGG